MTITGNEFVAVLRNSLTRFHDEAAAFVQSQRTDPVAGSIAATERGSFPREESLHTVSAIAGILLESVADHVTTFLKTITEPVAPIACWTCVRSMLESASIAAWLLEPGIDAKTRVGRAFAHRYEGMDQELKLMRALGLPEVELQKLEAHINNVENVAASLGFPRLRNVKHKRTGIGQQMPSATEMIKLMLDEERAYRLLSAVAHGHEWAVRQLGFKQGPTLLSPGGVTTTAFLKHSGTAEGYGYLAILAAKSLGLPLWNQCLYYGWEQERLTAILESVYDDMRVTSGFRFWTPKAA